MELRGTPRRLPASLMSPADLVSASRTARSLSFRRRLGIGVVDCILSIRIARQFVRFENAMASMLPGRSGTSHAGRIGSTGFEPRRSSRAQFHGCAQSGPSQFRTLRDRHDRKYPAGSGGELFCGRLCSLVLSGSNPRRQALAGTVRLPLA